MKEETMQKAKFYLKQYAENLSDRIGDIKTLLSQSEYQLERAKNLVPTQEEFDSKDYQIEHYTIKVKDWKDRLEKRSTALAEIDTIISEL